MKNSTTRFTRSFYALILTAIVGSGSITACGTPADNGRANENSAAVQNKNVVNNESGNSKAAEAKTTPAETDKAASIPVYDGREGISNAAQKQGTAVENQMLNTEFKSVEAAVMQKSKFQCDEGTQPGVEIVGTAEGAFTKPNAAQKAFLYERCRSGRSFGIGGIIIVENGKVAAHYTYGENGLSNGLLALPDINKNGLSELVLVSADMNQGYGITSLDIIEATGQNTVFLGRTQAHSDNSGAAEDDANVESTDYVISVQPSANPTFTRDVYVQKGEKGKEQLTKKAEKFSLNKEEPMSIVKIS